MLDFQQRRKAGSRRPPNYLERRQQHRLFVLVALLGLVVLLVSLVRNPDNHHWFEFLTRDAPGEAEDQAPIDRRVPQPADEDPDVFRAPAEPPAADAKELFAGVDAAALRQVRDNMPLQQGEMASYFNLMQLLQDTDQQRLETASSGTVSYRQLYRQPLAYRGKLVTLRGAVRGVREVEFGKNDHGFRRYWEVGFEPRDYPGMYVEVHCLELPPGFPRGMKLNEEAAITGFFFKRWLYLDGREEIVTAPLVLTKTVSWQPPPAVAESPVDVADFGWVAALVAAASLGLVGYLYLYTKRHSDRLRAEAASADVSGLAALAELPEFPGQEETAAALLRQSGKPAGDDSAEAAEDA